MAEGRVRSDYASTRERKYGAWVESVEPGSPAYNRGTTSGLALLPSVDLAGNPRVFGKGIDIGCYESQRKFGFSLLIK